MKNLFYILLLLPSLLLSQTPQGFKYQAVIRNSNGSLVTNQQVSIKTSLISGSALGNVDYSEQHDVATNGYGVASFTVGSGTPITGTYAAVNWSANDYFLKTELDIQNNGNFQLMGTSQILSVPYASHASTANSSLVDNDTSATNEIQQLSLQGNQLILSGGGSVTLTGTVDLDADPSNELQTLSLSNDTLYLTNGNYVVLPPDSDADTTNEIQTLANTAGTISISGSNTITLADSSATNELQTLSQTAGSISISNGNTITILDSSATNELQSLTVIGQDSLMITNGNTIKIPSLDNSETNEIQNLSINQNTISISSGNSIDIPINNDNDSINELQNLTYSNDTLSISNGNNVVIENDNFDWLYPDGKKDITPLISIPNNYSPPSGKRLYVTQLFSENSSSNSSDSVTVFNYSGSIQTYDVPNNVTGIFIEVLGAQGGGSTNYGGTGSGGKGALMSGDFNVLPGQQLKILVGQQGTSYYYDGGGGGGSFVTNSSNTPLIIAGGGGGASYSSPYYGMDATTSPNGTAGYNGGTGGTSGSGGLSSGYAGSGGGFFTNGGNGPSSSYGGGKSFLNGGAGGTTPYYAPGGYGGGGGTHGQGWGGGGGGGYSGGGASSSSQYGGGGGGSYNIGDNQNNQSGVNSGNGSVIISVFNFSNPFKIDSNIIFSAIANSSTNGSVVNPIILDTNNNFNFDNDSLMSASGFLIDANSDYSPVSSALNDTTGSGSGIYTVPSGKILVILNLYSEGSIYAKPTNSSAITIYNTQNSYLGNPIFLNEGDVIYGVGTINGYLMNK